MRLRIIKVSVKHGVCLAISLTAVGGWVSLAKQYNLVLVKWWWCLKFPTAAETKGSLLSGLYYDRPTSAEGRERLQRYTEYGLFCHIFYPVHDVSCYLVLKCLCVVFSAHECKISQSHEGEQKRLLPNCEWNRVGRKFTNYCEITLVEAHFLVVDTGWIWGRVWWGSAAGLLHEWPGWKVDSCHQLGCRPTDQRPTNHPRAHFLHSTPVDFCASLASTYCVKDRPSSVHYCMNVDNYVLQFLVVNCLIVHDLRWLFFLVPLNCIRMEFNFFVSK